MTSQEIVARISPRVKIVPTGCWEWQGQRQQGYGRCTIGTLKFQVHRMFYEAHTGPIPLGLQIDHLCRNRACCNPAHLEAVTPHENWKRGESITRQAVDKTHCPRGHAYDEANTIWYQERRYCRACHRIHSLRYTRKKRLEKPIEQRGPVRARL